MQTQTLNPVFGSKHQAYISRAKRSTMSVAEGAVRAGKTIDNIAAFAWMIHHGTPDRIHLATGSTVANAKLNIGDANGYGLEYIFRGRCRWTKYKGNEALAIKSKGREYVVIFSGGAKSDSYKKIRGNSYGMWIATEINLHHDDTIKEAFNRQLAARNRRIFWDLNPTAPSAWIYTDYIDCFDEQFGNRYNYEHFTIYDNATISKARLAEIESQYIPGTIWYQRDILGKRCIAEGLIYQTFADNTTDFLIDDPLAWCRENNQRITRVMIGVDFGGTKSATTFVAVGITNKLTVLALDQEWMDSNDLDPDKLNKRFADFVERVTSVYGEAQTRADSAESVLIRGIRGEAQRQNLRCSVHNARKMEINDRIKLVLLLMAQKRVYVTKKCEHLIDALQTAVYDPKSYEDVRLDDGTSDIDSLDAFEYCLEPWYQQLLRYGEKPYQSILR